MANYYTKMMFIQCMLHYDVVAASGKGVRVPFGCSRSISLMEPTGDIEVLLVKRDATPVESS